MLSAVNFNVPPWQTGLLDDAVGAVITVRVIALEVVQPVPVIVSVKV